MPYLCILSASLWSECRDTAIGIARKGKLVRDSSGRAYTKINGRLLIVAKLGGRKHHQFFGFVVGLIDLEHSRKSPRDSFFLSLLYVVP